MRFKLILLALLIPILSKAQTTMTFNAPNPGVNSLDSIRYTYIGKAGGFSWLYNAQKIRAYINANSVGAFRGLTKTGNKIGLGGILDDNAEINTTSQKRIEFGDLTNGNTLISINPQFNSGITIVAKDSVVRPGQSIVQGGLIIVQTGSSNGGRVHLEANNNVSSNDFEINSYDPINSFLIADRNFNHGAHYLNHYDLPTGLYIPDKLKVDSIAKFKADSTISAHPGTGGTVTSITPGYGFTSSTPITTTGTLTVDTASSGGLLSKSRANLNYVYLYGSYTNPSWLVSIPFSKITSKPTTKSGYGITDVVAYADTAAMLSNVVHRAGIETITGPKTLTAVLTSVNILPTVNNTSNLGSASFLWASVFGVNFNSGSSSLGLIAGTGANVNISAGVTQIAKGFGGTANWIFQKGGTFTDNGQRLQIGGRVYILQHLSGTAHTDSVVVHDNTSKELKVIGANALTDGLVGNILSKTADYTIVSGDFASGKRTILDLYVDATSGNVIITLPSASTFAGYEIYVTKTDASANTVTINTVSGLNTLTTQYQSRHFMNNASNWFNH